MSDTRKLASESYVEKRFDQEVRSKTFMSIDPSSGNFMIPADKAGGVQRYGRLKIVWIDGIMTLELDGKYYTKNEDGTYLEVSA